MPTYDYICKECNIKYVEVHSFRSPSKGCPSCRSSNVDKTISNFAAKTDRTFEKSLKAYEDQGVKDIQRFWKDDKFAANITGADDPDHAKKLEQAQKKQSAKAAKSKENFFKTHKRVTE